MVWYPSKYALPSIVIILEFYGPSTHFRSYRVWSVILTTQFVGKSPGGSTVKLLNFRMLKNCCILPKIQTKRPNLGIFHQKDANGIANREDLDQTAPLGAV